MVEELMRCSAESHTHQAVSEQEVILPLYSKLMNSHLGYCVQLLINARETWAHCRAPQRTTRMIKGTDCPSWGKAEKARTVQCKEGSRSKLSISVYKYVKEGCKVMETSSLQWSPVTDSGGSWHRRFCLKFKKHFFTMSMTECWNRMPREVHDSTQAIWTQSWVTNYGLSPLSEGVVEPYDLQRSFPTSANLGFCDFQQHFKNISNALLIFF